MKKRFFTILTLCTGVLATYAQGSSDFPYNNSFNVLNSSELILTGNVAGSGTAALTGGINLVDASAQTGGIYLKNLKFSTDKGFVMDFTFCVYPGIQNPPKGNLPIGSGFSLVLYDPTSISVDPSQVSSMTGSITLGGLGYAYSYGATISNNSPLTMYQSGFKNAYLGISMDFVGASKALLFEKTSPGDSWGPPWRTGIPNLTTEQKNTKSDITIRGPINPNYSFVYKPYSTSYTYYFGNPVLMSQVTNSTTKPNYWELDGETGDYISYNKPVGNFTLNSDAFSADPTNTNYRRAILRLYPGVSEADNTTQGFYINLSVYHGSILTRVVTDYFIESNSTVTYNDVTQQNTSNSSSGSLVSKTLSLKPPTTLSLAFVGNNSATYASIQNLSNLNIVLPFSPELPDASAENICKILGRSSAFTVLDDAIGYNTNEYTPSKPPVGKRSYVDLTSFQFQTMNATTGKYEPTAEPYVCTTKAGKYTYNPTTGYITLVPGADANSMTQDFIYYNIKNKPSDLSAEISTEAYRSRVAKTTVTLTNTDCPPVPTKYVKINK